LGEESTSADYWKAAGDEALKNGIKGVIMMVRWDHLHHSPHLALYQLGCLHNHQGAHWDATGDRIEVAMNPKPGKSPLGMCVFYS